MSLQVCKAITLLAFCDEHIHDEDDDLGEDPPAPFTVLHSPAEEPTMTGTTCTKKGCFEVAAADSVQCPRHRDIQRNKNAKYAGRPAKVVSTTVKCAAKYCRSDAAGISAYCARHQPAPRHTHAPIVLAEPILLNPPAVSNGNGHASNVTVLDPVIEKLEAQLTTLKGSREILATFPT